MNEKTRANAFEIVSALLNAGADPNSGSESGATALHAGVTFMNSHAIESLIRNAGDKLNVDAGLHINNATSLGVACFAGDIETVRVLLDAGASVAHVNEHGGNKLTGDQI